MKKIIRKGLNLPITGAPSQQIEDKIVGQVALMGRDYNGMKPSMRVKEGDLVKKGQVLFECKKQIGVLYTAPVAGKVVAINRGDRRAFQSIVIELATGNDKHEQVAFENFKQKGITSLNASEVAALLIESGLWTALRTRPYSKNPAIGSVPSSIFINAMDTNPLSPNPAIWIGAHREAFKTGVQVLSMLPKNKTYVCKSPKLDLSLSSSGKIEVVDFDGPHPAGNSGTHIHFLDPASQHKTVWYIGYQDVIAIGKLFTSGELFSERLISLAGPVATRPRLIKTMLGANVIDLVAGETNEKQLRAVSGSPLYGHKVEKGAFAYLGRYANQVTLLKEETEREFLGWQKPGFDIFSVMCVFASKLIPGKLFSLGTSKHGSFRAIVPVGAYEKVMPLDILATPLLKSLLSGDTDTAQGLGCLELDEEDLALCTFVDPGKTDFGPVLRQRLIQIEKEG